MSRVSTQAQLSRGALPAGVQRALELLDRLLGSSPGWVVGGALRDALLGEPVAELDVAVSAGAIALGRAMAQAAPGSGFVVLDEERGMCRVLSDVHVDIADLRGPDLGTDLRRRDFTVDALAASLHDLARRGDAAIEDATGGLADLAARTIRPCGPDAVADDPVRALRGVRLAIRPGWHLHASAEAAIKSAAPRLGEVAAERVRAELAAILADAKAAVGLRLLDRLEALPVLLPESLAMRSTTQPEPHRFDVWEHSLRAVEAADEMLADLGWLEPYSAELAAHLAEPIGDGFTRREALKLAALLHDVAKPERKSLQEGRIRFFGHDVVGAERAAAIARRWRLSRRATAIVERLVAQHLRPMHLGNAGGISRRARYRFFRDLGSEARDLVLLAIVDAAAVRGDAPASVWRGPGGVILQELMRGVGEERQAASAAPLLRGEDVMEAFALAPGPEIGRLLTQAREAQALGLVVTPREALEYLRRRAASA